MVSRLIRNESKDVSNNYCSVLVSLPCLLRVLSLIEYRYVFSVAFLFFSSRASSIWIGTKSIHAPQNCFHKNLQQRDRRRGIRIMDARVP